MGWQTNGAASRHKHNHTRDRNAENTREDEKVAVDSRAGQAVFATALPSAACAAASRAIGTRNGEHDT